MFTSSASVVPPQRKDQRHGRELAGGASADTAEEALAYVTPREDARAHAVARAEAIVLEAR